MIQRMELSRFLLDNCGQGVRQRFDQERESVSWQFSLPKVSEYQSGWRENWRRETFSTLLVGRLMLLSRPRRASLPPYSCLGKLLQCSMSLLVLDDK